MKSALKEQIGGDHYRTFAVQPVEYVHANGLGYIEGCVVKYVSRWKRKGGIEDLEKARHYLELLIELEQAREAGGYVSRAGVSIPTCGASPSIRSRPSETPSRT